MSWPEMETERAETAEPDWDPYRNPETGEYQGPEDGYDDWDDWEPDSKTVEEGNDMPGKDMKVRDTPDTTAAAVSQARESVEAANGSGSDYAEHAAPVESDADQNGEGRAR